MIPSCPQAFLVFAFKAPFSSFMLKGSVMVQSRSSPYDDRMMFSVPSLTCLALSRATWVVLVLGKGLQNIYGSLLSDQLIVCAYYCLFLERLSLFSALVRFHWPVVFFSVFSDCCLSCQLFLVDCVLALVNCALALLCASTFYVCWLAFHLLFCLIRLSSCGVQ